MNYMQLNQADVVNGPGVRVSIFVSGCPHKCFNCFNQSSWDYNNGMPMTRNTLHKMIEYLSHPHIQGLTVLGGEPLCPENASGVYDIVNAAKLTNPHKDVWLYTGYTFEELKQCVNPHKTMLNRILANTDFIVDGRFIDTQKDLTLKFRGSTNQRILQVSNLPNDTTPYIDVTGDF